MVTYNPPRYLFRRYTVCRTVKGGKKFLEIGAGNLKLSKELAKYFHRGVALDFEPRVKNYYLQLPKDIQKILSIKIGDIFDLKKSQFFDCILACEVMEHIEDDGKFLETIRKQLKDGGQLIISVPAKQKYWSIHDEIAGHFRRYEKDALSKLLKESGFKDVRIHSYGFPFINFFRLLRVAHGKKQSATKLNWSKEDKTKDSGVGQISNKYDFLGWVVNPVTFFIPNLISSLFNNLDLSEGYIAVAEK
jgi:SAM-dependent methyltransferase